MGQKMSYSALPTNATDGAAMECAIQRAKKWVVFTCLLQLVIGIFLLLGGALLPAIVIIVFSMLGLGGVRKQNRRLLISHFAFTMVVYIFSLIGLVALLVYCHGCSWIIFLVDFVFILFQAIGLKHSRILITLTPAVPCERRCQTEQTQTVVQETQTPQQTVQASTQTPTAPTAQPPVYPPIAFAMPFPQNGQQQFYPMQPIRYPTMQQPVQIMPQFMPYMQPINADSQQPANIYPTLPVVYSNKQ